MIKKHSVYECFFYMRKSYSLTGKTVQIKITVYFKVTVLNDTYYRKEIVSTYNMPLFLTV